MYEFSHDLLHFITAALSIALFAISWLTYKKHNNRKFLFVCLAFFVFALKEIITALNIMVWHSGAIEVFTHALSLVILILFAIGIIRDDKK
ncbi:MAG TPA: hypothetical protein VJG90_08560 [Candidatus Nanoarchaeia archaeon]|nr:hypothetical protein [Candidatus Nanoarchaeia archaeon]